MTAPRHPDFDRYVEACNYPGRLDPEAIERHLADYCAALGVEPVAWRIEMTLYLYAIAFGLCCGALLTLVFH